VGADRQANTRGVQVPFFMTGQILSITREFHRAPNHFNEDSCPEHHTIKRGSF
jgi:hypothetical protein